MFSHVFTGVEDFDRALMFYGAVLEILGFELRFSEPDKPWAGWHSAGGTRPFFVIARPHDGRPHQAGNGQMVAFDASSREHVRAAYETGLAHGGTSEGAPGPRAHYHAHYYGAYLRDPEGNKIAIACHAVDP